VLHLDTVAFGGGRHSRALMIGNLNQMSFSPFFYRVQEAGVKKGEFIFLGVSIEDSL
jgi:hypothetical protein